MPPFPPRRVYRGTLPAVHCVLADPLLDAHAIHSHAPLIITEAPTPREGIAMALRHGANVLVVALPPVNSLLWEGLEVVREAGEVRIVFRACGLLQAEAHALLGAGYAGVLSPTVPAAQTAQILAAIGYGQQACALGPGQCEYFGQSQHIAVSEREAVMLELLCAGYSTAEIAARTFLAQSTVKAQVGALMKRFGVPNRVALAVEAVRGGILDESASGR